MTDAPNIIDMSKERRRRGKSSSQPINVSAYRLPKRADYEGTVHGVLPLCEGEELLLRSSLLLMRDRALATMPFASAAAWTLLNVVERQASEAALRSIAIGELRDIRQLCIQCVTTASSFDALFGVYRQTEEGGAA